MIRYQGAWVEQQLGDEGQQIRPGDGGGRGGQPQQLLTQDALRAAQPQPDRNGPQRDPQGQGRRRGDREKHLGDVEFDLRTRLEGIGRQREVHTHLHHNGRDRDERRQAPSPGRQPPVGDQQEDQRDEGHRVVRVEGLGDQPNALGEELLPTGFQIADRGGGHVGGRGLAQGAAELPDAEQPADDVPWVPGHDHRADGRAGDGPNGGDREGVLDDHVVGEQRVAGGDEQRDLHPAEQAGAGEHHPAEAAHLSPPPARSGRKPAPWSRGQARSRCRPCR